MSVPRTDLDGSSFDDGAALWHLSAETLRSRGLSAAAITRDASALLELVHEDDDSVVTGVDDVRWSQGPFTVHYRVGGPGGSKPHSFMLVGQVGQDDEATADASGYVVDLTAHLARTADAAVTASNEKRALIEQAKGAFMMAYGITEDEAFTILVSLSSRTNTKVRDVASTVVSLMNEVEYRELHCSQTLLNISQRVLARQRG